MKYVFLKHVLFILTILFIKNGIVRLKNLLLRKVGLIIFCILLNTITAYTQTDTLIFYPINNQVLQHCEIRNISGAKDGKLWLSTNKGVASFDGNDVHFFGHKESDITTMWTSSISLLRPYPDVKGNLYVVTVSGPVYYFNTKTGKTVDLDIQQRTWDNYIPKPYSDIYIENDESVWLARHNMGFIHHNILSKKTTSYTLQSDGNKDRNTVRAIRQDYRNKGILWLGTNNGIYSFNTKERTLQRNFKCDNLKDSSTSDIEILTMEITNADTIWFTVAGKGVGCYDIKTGIYTIYPYSDNDSNKKKNPFININYFQRKSKDEYYIGMVEREPGIFNIRTHEYSFKTKIAKDFPSLKIQSFIADSLGNCWCLIFGQLFYASNRKNKFTTIPLGTKSTKDDISMIFKTVIWDKKKQYYYAAFERSDAIVFDKNLKPIKSIQVPIINEQQQPNVTDIGLDNNGHLWMTGDVISIYDSTKGKMQPVDQLYPHLKFPVQKFQNLVLRENYLYTISSNPSSRSIYKINTTKFTLDSILLPATMLDKEGRNQFGILQIDSKTNYAYISNKRTLYQYNLKNGNLRLVKGLKFTTQTFSFFSNFHWYELDDDDNLWVSSNGIIRVYEPKNLKVLKKIKKDQDIYLLQSANLANHAIMGFVNSAGFELFDYRNERQYKISPSDGLISNLNSGIACLNNILFVGAELNALQYIPLNSVINQYFKRTCYLSNIQLFNQPYRTDTLPEYLHSLQLPHDKNFITLTFSSTEFEQPERLEYRYKLQGVNKDWVYTNYLNRTISYPNLKPGTYIFYAGIKNTDGSWSSSKVNLHIYIVPAWWQTSWFKIVSIFMAVCLVFWLISWRIKAVRKQEKEKLKIEREILELEAKALRAQMNPHFIFNCMNSIKSLIQQQEENKAVTYLTTFSKLIRTLFNNADKKEISLYDEIETCKLYLQLEAMRFDARFSYTLHIDESLDMKSVTVPALVVQPFIENSIWHGIVPRGSGGHIDVVVQQRNNSVWITIDDNGIGRASSRQNKPSNRLVHQSKGVNLTRSRLELDNLLKQREATLETIDKENKNGVSVGTKVIIRFNEQLS